MKTFRYFWSRGSWQGTTIYKPLVWKKYWLHLKLFAVGSLLFDDFDFIEWDGLGFGEERGRSLNIFSIFKKDGNVWLGIVSRKGR